MRRNTPKCLEFLEKGRHPLSLVARHVQPRDKSGMRGPLSQEFTNVLIKAAIELHDRQADAAAWWKHLIPLWTALIAASLAIASSLLTLRFSHPVVSGRFVRAGEAYPDAVLLDTALDGTAMGILWGKRIRLTFLVATTSTNTSGPGLAALHKKPRVANPPLTAHQ